MEFAVRKMSPKTLIRYAATNKAALAATTLDRKQIAALKRVLHRIALRHNERFFEEPVPGHPRLRMSLVRAKGDAIARARMSPGRIRAVKQRARLQAARNAYARYLQNGTNASWERFLRVHAKRGLSPIINRRDAAIRYN